MRFDFIVIGGGMMGAPCARYLAEAGHSVALVAAPEPAPGAKGPWASHYDAARITRHVAHDPDWAQLSARSIARYRELEARSGEVIFAEVGAAMAGLETGPLSGFTDNFQRIAHQTSTTTLTRDPTITGWHLPPGSVTSWEQTGAGWIDPRAMTRAQIKLAQVAGAALFPQAATTRQGTDLTLADGTQLSAGHIIVATGPHAAGDGLLPAQPAMIVWARTIAFIELDPAEATRLAHLPSLIWVPGPDWDYDLYALPPVRYPDGKTYLKIGGQKDGPKITSSAEMDAWFATKGDAKVGALLLDELRARLPDLHETSTHTAPCAVTWTETGKPYIDSAGPNLTILTGGNGAAAKCGDELGRLGAKIALGGSLTSEGYKATFEAVWT